MPDDLSPHELQRNFGSEDVIVIKESYDHKNQPWSYELAKQSPSMYIMMDKNFRVIHCPSGNELRRIYLENPEEYISEPIYVAIPRYLDKEITKAMDNW
jgi:hypothetical protein